MPAYDLKGKYALMTGASTGIGREIAKRLAVRGAHLALGALPSEAGLIAEYAAQLADTHGIQTWPLPLDLSQPDGPAGLYRQATGLLPRLDVLVNNAGVMAYGNFHEQPLERLERLLAVNVRAYMILMRLFLADAVARGEGRVLNVVSASAFAPTPHHALYGATKACIQSLSDAVRLETAGTGVRITTLNPAYVDTPLLKGEGFPKTLPWYKLGGLADAAVIAEKGVRALEAGRPMCVPGWRNRLSMSVLPRLMPRSLLNRIAFYVLKG